MNKLVMIKLKDLCYFDGDFEYRPFLVEKGADFEEKYNKLVTICKNYNDFQEIEDYIENNFVSLYYEERKIEV